MENKTSKIQNFKNSKVLIVDDNYHKQFLMQSILFDNNIECKAVNSGKKAIEELEKNDYNLILMDIEMPGMNGIETLNYIRDKFDEPKNKIPIIAVTAHQEYEKKINNAGFNFVIYNVNSAKDFIVIIKKYL